MSKKPNPALQILYSEKLESSGLTLKHAKQLGFVLTEDPSSLKLPFNVPGFTIPYYDVTGTQTKFFRFRYLKDTRSGFEALVGKKTVKYAQPPNTGCALYIPPVVDWEAIAKDAETPLIITEGELKAACASVNGFPTLALGGVWSFRTKQTGDVLLSEFKHFNLKGRTVYVVFDSDAATNPQVVAAESVFASELLNAGANVYITRLPPLEESKCGLDDFITKNSPEALADILRDPERTYEFAVGKHLHAMNEVAVYVRKQRFVWSHEDQVAMSPGEFKEHRYANRHHLEVSVDSKGGTTTRRVSTAAAWLQWSQRAEAGEVEFLPGAPAITASGNLNTWKGWGVSTPVKGDVTPWKHLLDHLFLYSDPKAAAEARRWFEAWCAYPLQNPGAKMASAAAIWGHVHGSGKTLLGHTLMRIYGEHAAELKDTDLDNERNSWAENKQFALADDITARGDRKFMRRLMTMITQKYITVDPKYINPYVVKDRMNYLFTSNDPDALYMDSGDRRFWIWECLCGKIDPALRRRYVEWRDSDAGIAALWHYFLSLDISWFDPQAEPPTTAGKASMIALGKSELGAFVHELGTNTDAVLARAGLKGDLFTAAQLHAVYNPHNDKKLVSDNALARELKRSGFINPATGSKIRRTDGTSVSVYAVRNLEFWRAAKWSDACSHFNKNYPVETNKKTKY